MSESPPIRRQLLREAVAENVSLRDGRAPRQRRGPAPAHRRPARRFALLALIPALALPVLLLLHRSQAARAEPDAAAAASAVPTAGPPRTAEDPRSRLTFAAPRPIDASVLPLPVHRVVLDPGHGGIDNGTVGFGLKEKELTLDIARRLSSRLAERGFEVLLTREGDRDLSLRERADFANQMHSDLFLSIHINWISNRARGVETYFLGPSEDPELNALLKLENRQSGYSLADMKLLLEGIYTGVRQDESRQLAGRIQRSLFQSLHQVNPELRNRGVKTAPFVVLVSTEMPAILAEVSCLSNQAEAELLSRPLYREHIAEALFNGIRGYADDVHPTEEKGS